MLKLYSSNLTTFSLICLYLPVLCLRNEIGRTRLCLEISIEFSIEYLLSLSIQRNGTCIIILTRVLQPLFIMVTICYINQVLDLNHPVDVTSRFMPCWCSYFCLRLLDHFQRYSDNYQTKQMSIIIIIIIIHVTIIFGRK